MEFNRHRRRTEPIKDVMGEMRRVCTKEMHHTYYISTSCYMKGWIVIARVSMIDVGGFNMPFL